MLSGAEWHVQTSIAWDSIDVWVLRRLESGGREHVSSQFTVHTLEKGALAEGGPTLRLSQDDAQQLMNGLWHAGIRPRDGSGSLAHVEATKAHLDDMRRLVFEEGSRRDSGSR